MVLRRRVRVVLRHRLVLGLVFGPRIEQPAHAELDVVRGDLLEVHRVVDGVQAAVGLDVAAERVAQIDVAIGELDRRVGRDLVADARMDGPGEIPLRVGVREAQRGEPKSSMPASRKL